jgi:23S rRNA (cytidine1920-2'-O)/16S rRNA (cytidine1409-2'-O)-methyltransferase
MFVSRAGQKLQHALTVFNIEAAGKVCADLGCSTGGFTDCLLQNGAKKVYAIDTGYGVLDWRLRRDPRVVVMERTNALTVELPEKVDVIAIDVGWTRQKLILPPALKFLKTNGNIISLLKPHYEAKKTWLKNGKVQERFLPHVIDKVKNDLTELAITLKDVIKSPIIGEKGGNVEYLLWIKK